MSDVAPPLTLRVVGFKGCPFHEKALAAADSLAEAGVVHAVDAMTLRGRAAFVRWRAEFPLFSHHATSPVVMVQRWSASRTSDSLGLVGGGDDLRLIADDAETAGRALAARLPSASCVRLFVSGDRSGVGKSSVCVALLGNLLRAGYPPDSLAYIKPCTQCTKPTVVSRFCERHGIAAVPVGPVVFYSGFTRAFLAGETPSSEELLRQIRQAVDGVAAGKRVVVIDGVGYPAVGSICGVSNAQVARTLQAPVLLVGKRGVGDAVDSFNLNAAYFKMHGVPVLGVVVNRVADDDSYYSLSKIKVPLSQYFNSTDTDGTLYGLLPEVAATTPTTGASAGAGTTADTAHSGGVDDSAMADKLVQLFAAAVDVKQVIADATSRQSSWSTPAAPPPPAPPAAVGPPPAKRRAPLSAGQIKAAAVAEGAASSG